MSNALIGNGRPLSRLLVFIGVLLIAGCTTVEVRKGEIPVYPEPPDEPRFYWERVFTGSADLSSDSSEDLFRRMLTGEKKTSKGIIKPYGISVKKGRIFVADTALRKVHVFDVPANNFYQIGDTKGPGLLEKPMTVTTDDQENVYVVDSVSKDVKKFSVEGKYLTTFEFTNEKGEKELLRPTGVAVTPDGTKLFVVDTGGIESRKHRVVVWDTVTDKFVRDIGKRGTLGGEFNLPNNIAMGKDGNLYVVDGGNFRVSVFTQEGEYLRSFGSVGRFSGQFSRPKGIAVDSENNIYVVDAAFGNFQIFNSDGVLLMHIGTRNKRGHAGEYFLPAGIAVDEDGRIYVGDQFFRKVDVYRPASIKEHEGYLGFGKKPAPATAPSK